MVVGGCGHVGLPLALAFAARGLRVTSYAISAAAVAQVNSGVMPFQEPGADELLKECIESGRFDASDDPGVAGEAEVIVGARRDAHFGPMVLVGLGGVAVEILKDVALAPGPVSPTRARAMIDSLAAAPLFRGARGRPPAPLVQIAG